jgi:hypothetical protein
MAHLLRSLPMVDVGTLQAAGGEGVRWELIAFRKFTRCMSKNGAEKSKHGARVAPGENISSRHLVVTT